VRSLSSRLEAAEAEVRLHVAAEAKWDWWGLVEEGQRGRDLSGNCTDADSEEPHELAHILLRISRERREGFAGEEQNQTGQSVGIEHD